MALRLLQPLKSRPILPNRARYHDYVRVTTQGNLAYSFLVHMPNLEAR